MLALAPSITPDATAFAGPSQLPTFRPRRASGSAPSPVASAVASAATKTPSALGVVTVPSGARGVDDEYRAVRPVGDALGDRAERAQAVQAAAADDDDVRVDLGERLHRMLLDLDRRPHPRSIEVDALVAERG